MSNKNGPDDGDVGALVRQADKLLEQAYYAYYASEDSLLAIAIGRARYELTKAQP